MHSIIVIWRSLKVGFVLPITPPFLRFSLFIVDLPKLHTIIFDRDSSLQGDNEDIRRVKINGNDSYDNTLIMKGK